MIKTIIFDFDGVIVESVDVKTKAFAKIFEPYGKEVVKRVIDYHLKNGGISRFDKFRYYYKEILKEELTEDRLSKLCGRFSNIVLDEVLNSPFVPGANSFLNKYRNFYNFYIVSGTPEDELEKIIKAKNLYAYFKLCLGSPMRKKALTKHILDTERLNPDKVVFVGDSTTDYEAAERNGIYFIGRVPDGHINPFPSDTTIITDMNELADILQNFSKNLS